MSNVSRKIKSIAISVLSLTALGSVSAVFAGAPDKMMSDIPGPKSSTVCKNNLPCKPVSTKTINGVVYEKYPNGTVIKRDGTHIDIMIPPGLGARQPALTAAQTDALTAKGTAAASINAPNAFGPSVPVIFANLLYVNHWPTTTNQDGGAGFGFSVGDPHRNLGLLVSGTFSSLGFNSSGFASNGGFGLRLNRYFNDTTAFAFGVSNVVGWGAQASVAKGYYGAVTKSFNCFLPLTFNVGAGTGGLSSLNSGATGQDNNIFPFASAGIELYRNLSAILDYTTGQVSLGANYTWTIIPQAPIFIGAYAVNLNEYQNSNVHFQGVVGVSHAFV